MRASALAALMVLLTACAYVSKGEYDESWDADGDGWPLDEDCDDADPERYPYAPDLRGDGCDSDCGMEPDADGDDWPDVADCDPDDPTIHPCAEDVPDDGVDSDCDGLDTPREDDCDRADPDWPDVSEVHCSQEGA